jgi:hypothetical protein
MRQNGAVVGQVPILFNKISKGGQKGWKTKFHQIRFSASQTIPYYKKITPVVI